MAHAGNPWATRSCLIRVTTRAGVWCGAGQFTGLGTPDEGQELLDELGVTYPAGYTNDANIIKDYKVLGMPTTVFIDAQGEIFNKWTGALNGEVLEEKTLEMLNQ